jgi:hypothetical protein
MRNTTDYFNPWALHVTDSPEAGIWLDYPNIVMRLSIVLLAILLILPALQCPGEALTYGTLAKEGIVSGFGIQRGDPLSPRGRIPAINAPSYVAPAVGLYPRELLCIGTQVNDGWVFSPVESLNSHEVVNHQGKAALCWCPLAGLCISVEGDMTVSGLLRYDTFVLFDNETGDLIIPFLQRKRGNTDSVRLREIQLVNYRGVLEKFPTAKILDPNVHKRSQPYGSYPSDGRVGLGHARPGLTNAFSKADYGYHPKDIVLVAGRNGIIEKAYPLVELKRTVPRLGGSFKDRIGDEEVKVHYSHAHGWANVVDSKDRSLNVAYAYFFAFVQNLPDVPIFKAD